MKYLLSSYIFFLVIFSVLITSSSYTTSTNDLLPKSSTNQIVKHNYYILSYNERYEQAEWVAYNLTKNDIRRVQYKRPFFILDKAVKTKSADWKNYKNSGYDKGHLCPAADRKQNKKAYDETFFTSNISPQLPDFNRGVWNRLEEKIRYWSLKFSSVYVITGGVLKSGLKTIGKEKVAVPNHFYKIVARRTNGELKIIAFLVPHKESNSPLYEFVVSVNKIEKETGIDFFPKLEDSLEDKLEQSSDYKNWSF